MNAEDFGLLRQNPAFQDFMRELEVERQWHIDRILRGATLLGTSGTAELTARFIGIVEGIDKILFYKPEKGETSEDPEDHSA